MSLSTHRSLNPRNCRRLRIFLSFSGGSALCSRTADFPHRFNTTQNKSLGNVDKLRGEMSWPRDDIMMQCHVVRVSQTKGTIECS